MPGICYHVYYATLVKNYLCLAEDKVKRFYEGNFIPDMFGKEGKNRTHMYIPYTYGFTVPDMDRIFGICRPHFENPIVLGIYSHLYLDDRFIREFLVPSFDWNVEKGVITNPKTGYTATKEEFFGSKDTGLYGAYTSINPLLIKECNLDIESIPEKLEMSGIEIYDVGRREKTWKEELNGYLAQSIPYTGEILDYQELTSKIRGFALDLATELSKIL
ncbi:MAG: hypothetical protein Q4D02_04010 [Clostridia bacterium]|nr:hypothetical protein [Clostridia bacterium]